MRLVKNCMANDTLNCSGTVHISVRDSETLGILYSWLLYSDESEVLEIRPRLLDLIDRFERAITKDLRNSV